MSVKKEVYEKWLQHCKYIADITQAQALKESAADTEARKKKALKDYNYFAQKYFPHYTYDKGTGTHIDCADFHIKWANQVLKDKNFFGVAEWPREHAKSVHCCVILPIWLHLHGELDGLVATSKSEDAAIRLLGDLQAEFQENQLLIQDWGQFYNTGTWEEGEFVIKTGQFFIALGRGQSPRGIRKGGKRPNVGVCDDIDDDEIVNNQHRVVKVVEWLLGAFYGALDIRQSRFMMVGNRFHPKQVLAHIVGDVEEGDPKREGLYHSKVYATQNGQLDGEPTWWQKYSKKSLQFRFGIVGTIMALREYFHKYVIKGKRFKSEWIRWDKIPPLKDMEAIVVYFDPSYKAKTENDFKAVRFWGKKGIKKYLIKSFVRQTTITQAVKWMYDLYEQLPDRLKPDVDFYMEEVFLQGMFFADFEAEAELRGYYLPIRGDKRDKPDKFARIEAMTPDYERDHVVWNEAERKSPDMQNGYLQYMGFEKGSPIHDDAPDADEGAWYYLNKKTYKQKAKAQIGTDKNEHTW